MPRLGDEDTDALELHDRDWITLEEAMPDAAMVALIGAACAQRCSTNAHGSGAKTRTFAFSSWRRRIGGIKSPSREKSPHSSIWLI